jgi:hypothetical protein
MAATFEQVPAGHPDMFPTRDFITFGQRNHDMYSKFWLVIKDDSKKTFEVYGQAASDNAFTNKVYGMQRAGLNVSAVVLPITNKTSSKDLIRITGYSKEEGLYNRMEQAYQKSIRDAAGAWEGEDE